MSAAALLCFSFAIYGCASKTRHLQVQLVTGLSPSVEFSTIETTLFAGDSLATEVGPPQRTDAMQGTRYQQGSELTSYDIEPGTYRVRVVLSRNDGSALAAQSVVVQVSQDYVLRVHITRDCAGVMCPGAGAEELTACLVGQCVDPRCDSAHPELCPDSITFCSDASACPSLATCASQACIDGICVEQSSTSTCTETEWCHPERGCTPLTGGDEGYGAVTRGGAGYEVVHVTNLNTTGEGSLHDAIGSDRTVVFDVAGTIVDFRFDSSSDGFPVSHLTIDGTTAPAPGITLDNNRHGHGLSFQDGCHDIIVRGLRMRNAGEDGFSIASFGGNPPYNILFDRCSSSGNSDGAFDITSDAHDISIQNCIFGGGDGSLPGYTGVMLISYGAHNVSLHHNLFSPRTVAGPGESCPGINNPDATEMPTYLVADFRNNLIWKWGRDNGTGSGYASAVWHYMTANFVNNYYFSEQSPEAATNVDDGYGGGPEGFAYMAGNLSGNDGVDPNARTNHELWSVPFAASVTTQDACTAARIVLQQSGVRPLDAIDQAIVDDVTLPGCD